VVIFEAISWLLTMLSGILQSASTGLPGSTVTALQTPTGWIATAASWMTWVGLFVNLTALEQFLTLLITWWTMTFVVRLVVWLYHIVQ